MRQAISTNNERLINWFVEYCQRKCGQTEIDESRSLPLAQGDSYQPDLDLTIPLTISSKSSK